jgi:hypothetical protein
LYIGGSTPQGYSPGATGIHPLATPTTQLTLASPTFNLQPVPNRKNGPQVSGENTPKTSNGAMQTGKPSTHAPRGQLHVKLIQARGLAVKSALSRPYVVVVYEQNEFISREPTREDEKEVKGKPTILSRQGSSVNVAAPPTATIAHSTSAMSVLGGIQKAFDIKPRSSPSPPNGTITRPASSSADSPEEGAQSSSRSSSGSSGGSKVVKNQSGLAPQSIHNATNPVWKHQVSL